MKPNAILQLIFRVVIFAMIAWIVIGNFLDLPAAVGYAQSRGVPFAGFLVPLAQLMLGVAGVLIGLGRFPKVGLLLFMIFLAVVTPLMHPWWTMEEGFNKIIEVHSFQSNVMLFALLGTLLFADDFWPRSMRDWYATSQKG